MRKGIAISPVPYSTLIFPLHPLIRRYRYDWSRVEAAKNILRTHTTAVSTRMLYQLAQQPTFQPIKYFSIDRVFRNETLDATHLAEFHQVFITLIAVAYAAPSCI